TYSTRCSTALTGDMNPSNNFLTDSVIVRVRDVGVVQILTPSGTIDSGVVIIPQAKVKNYGSQRESFLVTFKIGNFYTNTQTVANLNPGDSVVVGFASWTALQRGNHSTKCTVALTGDINPSNNFLTGSVTVRVRDVGVSAILMPSGIIDSGTSVAPRIKIKNFGNERVSFPVWFRIYRSDNLPLNKIEKFFGYEINNTNLLDTKDNQIYEDSIFVELSPGDSAIRDFRIWTATIPDTYSLVSFSVLSGDMNSNNDTAYGSVIVRKPLHDVGVLSILAPIGSIDSGRVVNPQAVCKNFGTISENFPVIFRIGEFYIDTLMITLDPGRIDTVEFNSWIASPIGTHIMICSTALASDTNLTNNFVRDSVRVVPGVEIAENKFPLLPNKFSLEIISSNIFGSKILIKYGLPRECDIKLEIYNSSGKRVCILKINKEKPGFYYVVWDGCDKKGNKVGKGVYFCRMEAGNFIATRKIIKVDN
ncbi:MAG: FlgD immunoglobulin-like domain containing protein, partial [candidate division WOR-3 bacterium]